VYIAGAKPNVTDVVAVVDSLGNGATASVSVKAREGGVDGGNPSDSGPEQGDAGNPNDAASDPRDSGSGGGDPEGDRSGGGSEHHGCHAGSGGGGFSMELLFGLLVAIGFRRVRRAVASSPKL
jgi:hypothetical protein